MGGAVGVGSQVIINDLLAVDVICMRLLSEDGSSIMGIGQMFDDGDFGLCDAFNIQLEQPGATPYDRWSLPW